VTLDRPRALDTAQARRYRARRDRVKHCRICHEPASYAIGRDREPQCFDGPHVVVLDPGGPYGVALEVFFATHEPIPDRPDHYVKVAFVRAWVATDSFVLTTEVAGRVEMVAQVPAGAYVVENPNGERYHMAAEEFWHRYELDE
jgi:hypothetical protein